MIVKLNSTQFTAFAILATCKGGGYMYCRTSPPHPRRNSKGLYPLHRVLMENKLGRFLSSDEDVHHMDEDKNNNNPDNLEVLTKSDHAKHHIKTLPLVSAECANCEKVIIDKAHVLRHIIARNKSKLIFCSYKCSRAWQVKVSALLRATKS